MKIQSKYLCLIKIAMYSKIPKFYKHETEISKCRLRKISGNIDITAFHALSVGTQ